MFASNTSQVSSDATYIEDVFSTYLYTGNGSTQTITNGIDLAGKGGMVWLKSRSAATYNALFDTSRGANNVLWSNTANAQVNYGSPGALTSFGTTGFGLNAEPDVNNSGDTYASWTFRKQPKFFDVVTYTGNGVAGRTVAHNLGSVPGCMIVKRTDATANWMVYHIGVNGGTNPENYYMQLNQPDAQVSTITRWYNTAPTSTNFTLGDSSTVNANGGTYVAYLFAHNAGGFGLTGTDNVISCGSFTTDGVGSTQINLGYEPQWIMFKKSSAASQWYMFDTMRGLTVYDQGNDQYLWANDTGAEGTADVGGPNATGFEANEGYFDAGTWIYIAIRRGPMKTPTTGTSVYNAVTVTGNSTANRSITGFGFPLDLLLSAGRTGTFLDKSWNERLIGAYYVRSTTTAAEDIQYGGLADPPFAYMDGYQTGTNGGVQYYWNNSGDTYVQYGLKRAPGFFDVVCYTGTGTNTTQTHNLGVVPELILFKVRSTALSWWAYSKSIPITQVLLPNSTAAATTPTPDPWNSTAPTSTVFSLGGSAGNVNSSGNTFVAYLFASCPGVSKVGSYTGNGSSQTINCGFTSGARFVMIKRTDSTGDWVVFDTARGIVSGNDPFLLLNSTAAEATGFDNIDPDSSGFIVNQVANNRNLNVSGATYIYLAIA